MGDKHFNGTEQLEMTDNQNILPNHFSPNALRRVVKTEMASKKFVVLLILLIVNIAVTLALIAFIGVNVTKMDRIEGNVSAIGAKLEKQIGQLFPQYKNNNWNPADCHSDLVINETRKSVQRNATNDYAWRSCRALMMASRYSGLFYYEVGIMHRSGDIEIGLAPKKMPLDERLWVYLGTAYKNNGAIWGRARNDPSNSGASRRTHIDGPQFGVGDTVGVGVNLYTRKPFYTKNGQRLDTANLYVGTADLYPAVSLRTSPDSVVANFGPNFRYNLSQEFGDGIVPSN